MQKKLLNILLCGVLVIGLTGCNTKQEEVKNSNNPYSKEEKKTITEISSIRNYYHGEIALVSVNEEEDGKEVTNLYIADEEGNLSFYGRSNTGEQTTLNGYLLYNPYTNVSSSLNANNGLIYDKNGRIIYQSSANRMYGSISKEGNYIVLVKTDSLSGETYKTELLDQKGNVIFSVEGKQYAGWLVDEVFYITDEEGCNLIDAKTKKTIHVDNKYLLEDRIKASNNYIVVGNEIYDRELNLMNKVKDSAISQVLNDEYYLSDEYIPAIYSIKDKSLVYSFDEGGLTRLFYYDGIYYVRSKTDYIYTLDENFNIVAEPEKSLSNDLLLTSEGVISNVKGYCIIDKNLECKTEIGYGSTIGTINWDNSDTNNEYVYFSKDSSLPIGMKFYNRVYNLKTKEWIEFKK